MGSLESASRRWTLAEIEIRTIDASELHAFAGTIFRAFGERPPDGLDEMVAGLEPQRTYVAVDGSGFVGGATTLSLRLTVPGGGDVAVGGLSWVGVLPTHRRRGTLRRLMAAHLDDVRERGELAGALFAAEAGIYGRFGYGIATRAVDLEIDPRAATLRGSIDVPGHVELVDRAGALDLLPDVHERIRTRTVGEVSRSPALWRAWFAETERDLDRAELFHAVHVGADGRPDGYALHRISERAWPQGLPGMSAEARILAETPQVRLALWRYLLGLDLVRRLTVTDALVDEPLRWCLVDPRQLRASRFADGLWLRIVDVAGFLSSRVYTTAVDLVLEITGPDASAGRYHLSGDTDGAACGRTRARPDVALDVATLGAIGLGTWWTPAVAAAGLIDERRDGAVARLAAAITSPVEPNCGTEF